LFGIRVDDAVLRVIQSWRDLYQEFKIIIFRANIAAAPTGP
jgi:hypothetical protein